MTNQTYREKKLNENIEILNNFLSQLYGLYFHRDHCDIGEEIDIIREIDKKYYEFNDLLKSTFLMALAYIESSGNTELFKFCKSELQDILQDSFEGIVPKYVDEIEETFYTCPALEKIVHFLKSFEFIDTTSSKTSGLIYLENILNNTGIIIKDLSIKPKSETKVYNSVKFVIKSIFPESVFPTESFQKTAKCYKPDILIPALNVAIEYKYAEDEATLVRTIDEILIDVKGYDNHPTYKLFYAVFYLKPGICAEKRFESIWKEKKFPKNWTPIYTIGE